MTTTFVHSDDEADRCAGEAETASPLQSQRAVNSTVLSRGKEGSPVSSAWSSSGHTLTQRFCMGSVAGTLSGIMAGLTGIEGPPVILMFRMLGVPKDMSRGSNAVINFLLMHWLLASFWFAGVLHRQDAPLFAAAGVVGLLGTFIGNRIASGMNQRAFNWALNILVIVCCILMFASAFGFIK